MYHVMQDTSRVFVRFKKIPRKITPGFVSTAKANTKGEKIVSNVEVHNP